jgi:hypothetical protein
MNTYRKAQGTGRVGVEHLSQPERMPAGRRKGKVQELFKSQGPSAAWTLGLKLGLKETTLRRWFAGWR